MAATEQVAHPPEPSRTWAVHCEGLTKWFDTTLAVDAVDLSIVPGQFVALLGPSGCGKSTTLRMIAGFEQPDRGIIEIGGERVADARHCVPPERRRVGMVFQEGALFPHMTVAANIAYGLRRSTDRQSRVDELLTLIRLEGLGHRMPHELSGGQQQRVALARALAPRPTVVLLDEPFSSLDAGLRASLRGEIRTILREAHATAVFVTHDQDEALSLADEVAVMWQGRIVQRAAPEELYKAPSTREVATFLGEANFITGQAAESGVATELGNLLSSSVHAGEVEVLIRPEALRLSLDETAPSRVVEREYYGHDRMYEIELPTGSRLKARVAGYSSIQVGDHVRVEVQGAVSTFPLIA
jgi:iron(III) transport system ATP-binding protein